MAYIPLNRIKTGFYTYGTEFVVKLTNQAYTGPYYKLYNGRYYSGETPNSPNSQEIIPKVNLDLNRLDVTTPNLITYYQLTNAAEPVEGTPASNIPAISTTAYQELKGINPNQFQTALPSYTPIPTVNDYKTGEFIRYFAKKQNQLYYQEISRDTFQDLLNKTAKYHWALYLGFSIPWQITGNKDQVQAANSNMVKYAEQRNKIRGLQEFLRFDYLKFYKS